jgi:hypothetical protein
MSRRQAVGSNQLVASHPRGEGRSQRPLSATAAPLTGGVHPAALSLCLWCRGAGSRRAGGDASGEGRWRGQCAGDEHSAAAGDATCRTEAPQPSWRTRSLDDSPPRPWWMRALAAGTHAVAGSGVFSRCRKPASPATEASTPSTVGTSRGSPRRQVRRKGGTYVSPRRQSTYNWLGQAPVLNLGWQTAMRVSQLARVTRRRLPDGPRVGLPPSRH